MEQKVLEHKWFQIEHALVLFMLTISGLGLSAEATAICEIPKTAVLTGFINRQRLRLEKPQGILIL